MASATRTRRDRTEKTLRALRPNIGIEAAYRRKLEALIDELHKSTVYWLTAAYRANVPAVAALAQDELSAAALKRVMRELSRRWLKRFDDAAQKLAKYFATAVSKRSDATLKRILKDGGISVEWRPTAAQRDIMQSAVEENVALIRNLPQQYLLGVQNSVMRSVQTGRDLKQLSDDLQNKFGIAKRRAQLIARDQNNKISGALNRARTLESKLEDGVWLHSHAGKKPRRTHVAMNGKRFKIAEGMYDSDEGRNVHCGELISCRCTFKPIVVGFS